MRKQLSFCNIYIILWLVYMLQSLFFGVSGTIYSQVIVAFQIVMSLGYVIYSLFTYKLPPYLKGLAVLLLMFTVYGVAYIAYGNSLTAVYRKTYNVNYLKNIYYCLLPVFPFYVFTRREELTKKGLMIWTIAFFFAAAAAYFLNEQRMMEESLYKVHQMEEYTNNEGYTFLSLIPLLAFFSSKRFAQYFGLAIVFTFLVMGMKRGAILIGGVCIVWFMFFSLKNASKRQMNTVLLLSVAFMIVGCVIVNNMMESSSFFVYRLNRTLDGDSSGRDVIYTRLWNHFLSEQNLFTILLGNGAEATLAIGQIHAHNDWLEILINQGLIGVTIYFLYWLSFFKSWKKGRYDDEVYLAMGLSLLIYFLKSVFSMSYGGMTVYATICIGYCLGKMDNDRERINYYKLERI